MGYYNQRLLPVFVAVLVGERNDETHVEVLLLFKTSREVFSPLKVFAIKVFEITQIKWLQFYLSTVADLWHGAFLCCHGKRAPKYFVVVSYSTWQDDNAKRWQSEHDITFFVCQLFTKIAFLSPIRLERLHLFTTTTWKSASIPISWKTKQKNKYTFHHSWLEVMFPSHCLT